MTASNSDYAQLVFKPGIEKNLTTYAAEGYYTSCDKIRFRYGRPEKIGGWVGELTNDEDFTGVARDIESWIDLDGNQYLAVGTHQKLQLFNGGEIFDITPIRASANYTSSLNTVSGSTLVTISAASNDTSAEDFVLLSGTVANITLTGGYEVVCAGTDYLVIDSLTTANATVSSGGSTLNVDYLLYSGLADNGTSFGWGAGGWGLSTWGTPRGSGGVETAMRQWSLTTWGEDLIANPRGGHLYAWQASAGPEVRAQIISAAPSINNFILLGQPARHLISFGTQSAVTGIFDPLLVRWSDSENYNIWTVSAGSTAGAQRIEGGNEIITAVATRREILILTDNTAYSMQYIEPPLVYAFSPVGDNCGAVSSHCAQVVGGIIFWWGLDNFYSYDGTVRVVDCSLQRFIFDQLEDGAYNYQQKGKIFCGTNQAFNEIIWLYPDKNNLEINRYVIHNYAEGTFYHGFLDRTVWQDVDVYSKPYAVNVNGKLYIHEQGYNDDAGPLKATLQSSFFDLQDGEQLVFTDKLIPDATAVQQYNMIVETKKYPNASETVTKGPFTVTTSTGKISMRSRGRQAAVRYSCSAINSFVRLGSPRITLKPDGGR